MSRLWAEAAIGQGGEKSDQGLTLAVVAQPAQRVTVDRVRLDELLQANRRLLKVYVLKDDLKHLWDYRYAGAAQRFWNEWYRWAMYSKIEPLKKFARNLKDYISGILSYYRWPLHTSVLEASTTRSKSSSEWPTASATMNTSSSKSDRPSPVN